jgi:hypothetical protein
MLQAFLLASSVVLMLGMCGALMALAALRVRQEAPAQAPDQTPEPQSLSL